MVRSTATRNISRRQNHYSTNWQCEYFVYHATRGWIIRSRQGIHIYQLKIKLFLKCDADKWAVEYARAKKLGTADVRMLRCMCEGTKLGRIRKCIIRRTMNVR